MRGSHKTSAKAKRMKRFLTATAVLWCLGCLCAMAQTPETRVFQLNNRPAAATVEMVRPLLSPTGRVLPETRLQKLIVTDLPGNLERVERLLLEIDQPAPHVRVNVTMQGISPMASHQVGIGLAGTARNPRVGVAAQSQSGLSTTDTQQEVLVMSGERGVITLTRDLVTVDPYFRFVTGLGLLPSSAYYQSVSTGFAVEPVVVGGVVRMTISPWLGFVGPDGRAEVLVNEAATTVSVPSGQTVTIASGGSNNELTSNAYGLIFGSAGLSAGQSATITVRPVIESLP